MYMSVDKRDLIAESCVSGCTPITSCNWYGWLKESLEQAGVAVAMQDMPDPYQAKQAIWLPFMRDVLKAGIASLCARCAQQLSAAHVGASSDALCACPDENSIIVGHSSGAEAAMRYAEVRMKHGTPYGVG